MAEIHEQYCISGGKNREDDDDADVKEMTLSANSDVECYHCGQKGHKKKQLS